MSSGEGALAMKLTIEQHQMYSFQSILMMSLSFTWVPNISYIVEWGQRNCLGSKCLYYLTNVIGVLAHVLRKLVRHFH